VTLALALAACSSGASAPHRSQPPTPNLNGMWIPTELAGRSVPFDLAARADAPVLFVNGQTWSGSDGCNGLAGTVRTFPAGVLAVTSYGSTQVGCNNVPIDDVFSHASSASVKGDALQLRTGKRVVGRFRRLTPTVACGKGFPPTEVRLQLVGGVRGDGRPLPGTITATDQHGHACTILVGAQGSTRLNLRAGSYTLTGRSPLYGSGTSACQSDHGVTVTLPPTGVAPAMPLSFVTVSCEAR
jgi:heat shock protein HslJ